jgi:hypothetical protein
MAEMWYLAVSGDVDEMHAVDVQRGVAPEGLTVTESRPK